MGRALSMAIGIGFLASASAAAWAKPPRVALVELKVLDKVVRVAHPVGWEGDVEPDHRSVRLVGPEGEGELLIATASQPAELGAYLEGLRRRHPGSTPSPPQAIEVPGIHPEKRERATRFVITGHEAGEMVMIERGGLIVLFAAVVDPDAWESLKTGLSRCYSTVEVADRDRDRPKP
jgi:hypothetical protein